MPRILNIKLKNTILVAFLLLTLLSPTKNIAANHDRNVEPIYIITDPNENINDINMQWATIHHIVLITDTNTLREISRRLKVHNDLGIFIKYVYGLLFIAGSIYTSLYNYFTGHNKIKNGWYHSKFLVYFGKKTNITKNFHLDLYFSLLNFCVNLFECLYITRDLLLLILKIISCDINIHVYKNFYFCFKPMSLIRIGILYIKRYLVRIKTKEYLLSRLPNDLPQNFNFDNIRCIYTDPQEHTYIFDINTDNII